MPVNRRLLPEGEAEKKESDAGILSLLRQVRIFCFWVAGVQRAARQACTLSVAPSLSSVLEDVCWKAGAEQG